MTRKSDLHTVSLSHLNSHQQQNGHRTNHNFVEVFHDDLGLFRSLPGIAIKTNGFLPISEDKLHFLREL